MPRVPSLITLFWGAAFTSLVLIRAAPRHSPRDTFWGNFTLIFGMATVLKFIWSTQLWPKVFSPLRHLPQAPDATFFNGHFWQIMDMKLGLPMRQWINEVPNQGLIRYLMHGNVERVFITNPKAIGEVLVQKNYDFVKPHLVREALRTLLGEGVLLAEGEEHKLQRKNLTPAFSFRHIKDLYPTFWSKSAEMCHEVTKLVHEADSSTENKSDGAIIEFGGWVNRATLDIIGIAGMGCDFGSLKDPNNELNVTYRQVFQPTRQAKLLGLLAFVVPTWFLRLLPLKRNLDVASAAAKIRGVSKQLIVDKQRRIAEKGETADKDILSVALESGGFTVENLVDQCMTFLAAGHETTATATQWAMVELSRNQNIQKRLRDEIRSNLPSLDENTQMTSEMVENLPYLSAVCNEVLRFWSPVPFTRREAVKDTTILDQFIPKGTDIVLVPWAVNFSRELWGADAEVFSPERWMGEKRANNGGAESAYSNMTFLHGPRSCIGSGFAKAEFKCLLAAIVGRFEVELEPKDREIELETGIVTRPKGGLPLRMKVVEGW